MFVPVHNVSDVFPLSLTSRLTVDMDPNPDADPNIISSLSSTNLLCLGVGCCLTVVKYEESQGGIIPSSVLDDMIDIEFEHDVASLCWGSGGNCLVVADVFGMLHIVAPATGDILFSHRVVPGM